MRSRFGNDITLLWKSHQTMPIIEERPSMMLFVRFFIPYFCFFLLNNGRSAKEDFVFIISAAQDKTLNGPLDCCCCCCWVIETTRWYLGYTSGNWRSIFLLLLLLKYFRHPPSFLLGLHHHHHPLYFSSSFRRDLKRWRRVEYETGIFNEDTPGKSFSRAGIRELSLSHMYLSIADKYLYRIFSGFCNGKFHFEVRSGDL